MTDRPERPPEPSPGGSAQECAQARALLDRFLATSLSPTQDRAFRTHIVGCPACRRLYRTTVASVSRARRQATAGADAGAARPRHGPTPAAIDRRARLRERRRLLVAGTRPRQLRWRLHTMLIPAGLVVLLAGWPLLARGAHLEVRWEAGAAEAAGIELDERCRSLSLRPGQTCATRGEARVRIEGHGAAFTLGGRTVVLLEDAREPWLRLAQGELELQGTGRVGSQLGLFDLTEGRARVRGRAGGLEVECLEGSGRLRSAADERALRPGERATLRPGEIRVEPGQDGS